MGYKQPFKKISKVEPGMKNQSKSGIYQIGAIKSKSIKELEKLGKSATSILQQAAFPEGSKGLTSPKPTKSFQFSGKGPSAYEYEKEKGAQRLFGKSASQLNESERIQNVLDARGLGKVRGEGGVLEQKEKFESQFGKGSSRMFNFADPKATVSQLQGLTGKAYDRAVASQKKLSADMYDANVEMANTMQQTGGSISTLKPQGIVTNLGYQTSAPSPQPKKTKKSTSSTRRRQNVLENVGEAIGSLNPFKPRFGPRSKAGRQSTGSRWMRM
jgi:hypothetical protein